MNVWTQDAERKFRHQGILWLFIVTSGERSEAGLAETGMHFAELDRLMPEQTQILNQVDEVLTGHDK